MTRRVAGPKRNAETYAHAQCGVQDIDHGGKKWSAFIRPQLTEAWLAGYRAASRKRRVRPA